MWCVDKGGHLTAAELRLVYSQCGHFQTSTSRHHHLRIGFGLEEG